MGPDISGRSNAPSFSGIARSLEEHHRGLRLTDPEFDARVVNVRSKWSVDCALRAGGGGGTLQGGDHPNACPSCHNERESGVYDCTHLRQRGFGEVALCLQYNIKGNAQVLKIPERQVQLAELCRQYTSLSVGEFWLCCVALGGTNTALELEAFLHGALRPTPHEFNLMALALNEHFREIEVSHFVPYIETVFDT
jgi:hypothetical protein